MHQAVAFPVLNVARYNLQPKIPQLLPPMNMNPDATSSCSTDDYPSGRFGRYCRSLSWGAILAGLTAALALQVLFMLLGAGLGFAIYTPITDANPVSDLGTGAVIVHGISAVFSLWFGGWVAGRFAPKGCCVGWLHGFLVWCAATVAGVLIVTAGAGWALGDLSKLVGGGLSLAGKPAAAVAGSAVDMAKDAAKKSTDTFKSFVDEATGSPASGTTPGATARAKREIGTAVTRLFTPVQEADMATNRTALVKALTDSGMSQPDADKMVTEWTDSYNQLKADLAAAKNEAEAKAREAADKAAHTLAVFSLCAFVAFVFGAIAATAGGCHGACRARKDEVAPVPAV
jgi:hypothetical protein